MDDKRAKFVNIRQKKKKEKRKLERYTVRRISHFTLSADLYVKY